MKAMQTLLFAVFAALIGIAQAQPVPAATVDPKQVREEERTKLNLYLSPKQASDFVTGNPKKVLFLDVRTRVEPIYIGGRRSSTRWCPTWSTPEMKRDWAGTRTAAPTSTSRSTLSPRVAAAAEGKGPDQRRPGGRHVPFRRPAARAPPTCYRPRLQAGVLGVGARGRVGRQGEKRGRAAGRAPVSLDYDLEKSKHVFVAECAAATRSASTSTARWPRRARRHRSLQPALRRGGGCPGGGTNGCTRTGCRSPPAGIELPVCRSGSARSGCRRPQPTSGSRAAPDARTSTTAGDRRGRRLQLRRAWPACSTDWPRRNRLAVATTTSRAHLDVLLRTTLARRCTSASR